MTSFREINNRDEWNTLVGDRSPFFAVEWEQELMRAFPYLAFRYFVYHDTHAVRVAQIGSRYTTVPFSDGGDVIALSNHTLDLEQFRTDLVEQFGTEAAVRVHSWFAPITDASHAADIIDFRVVLASFDVDSLRKTLRHIVDAPLPDDMEVREAQTADDVRQAYALYLATMHDVGGVALPLDAFAHGSQHPMLVCTIGGTIRGVAVFFVGESSAHHFISAADAEGRSAHAPHRLLYHALSYFRDAGKDAVFLGGTRVGSTLTTFKEGWRGEPCMLYSVGGASARESARTSPLRKLWGCVPASLLPMATKLVGKRVF